VSLDEILRETLNDPRLALPSWPDAVHRVNAGVRRRRRRRAAVVAVAVAVTLPLAGLAWTAAASRTRPAISDPAASATVRPTSAPCTARQLSAVLASGPDGVVLTVTNIGPTRCTLVDRPVLVTTNGSIQVVPLGDSPATPSADQETPATIDPGERAHATIVVSLDCNGGRDPVTYQLLAVMLLDTVVPAPGSPLVTTCPLQVSPWYRLLNEAGS
jgi:hypothetical protein